MAERNLNLDEDDAPFGDSNAFWSGNSTRPHSTAVKVMIGDDDERT